MKKVDLVIHTCRLLPATGYDVLSCMEKYMVQSSERPSHLAQNNTKLNGPSKLYMEVFISADQGALSIH